MFDDIFFLFNHSTDAVALLAFSLVSFICLPDILKLVRI